MNSSYRKTTREVFPKEFRWGVATASCQIEGSPAKLGLGESNWDVFSKRPDAVFKEHRPLHASFHVEHLEADLDLLAELGVSTYRFSLSWPRILPEGIGASSDIGLAFYDRLIDGLHKRHIEPCLTLFHWDTPAALEAQGGFRNPAMVGWFTNYVELVARRFGDRVRRFLTLNEPHAFIEGGLRHGRHAPGHSLPLSEVVLAARHALLCHGRATQVLRSQVKDAFVSAAPVLIAATPASDSEADYEAARLYTFERKTDELRSSAFWMDPLYGNSFSESAFSALGAAALCFSDRDLTEICQPLDAVGMNLYDTVLVRAGGPQGFELVKRGPGYPITAFQWPITPEGHYYGPRLAFERYRKPIWITENGLSCRDFVALDGKVHDAERVDFIDRHLTELAKAISRGIPVEAYLHWSLLDNFEWNHGYRERFGLVYVDYEAGERTAKDSFFAFRDWATP